MAAPVPAPTAPDPRRITEHDPDVVRVKTYWQRRLLASVRALVSDLRRGGTLGAAAAQSAFIHRHVALLQAAYLAAHREGQRDYWGAVSLRPDAWLRKTPATPSRAQTQKRLLFYGAASVAKMAREATLAATQTATVAAARVMSYDEGATARLHPSSTALAHRQHRQDTHPASATLSNTLADPPPELSRFTSWAAPRVALQADITWSGFQDGYLDAASADAAGLRLQVWWELEPAARHCDDCPQVAAASPYDAPGSSLFGGNELMQTPGDGNTACGAACKCSLRYGWTDVASGQEVVTPADVLPADVWEAAGVNLPDVAAAPAPEQSQQPQRTQAEIDAMRRAALEATFGKGPPEAPPPPPTEAGAPVVGEMSQVEIDAMRAQALEQTFSSVTPLPIDGLTTGQKQALDDLRAVALAWDAVRGDLPPFEAFIDPDSPTLNVWRNVDLETLTTEQKALIKRYFDALGDWADHSPAWWGFESQDMSGGDLTP